MSDLAERLTRDGIYRLVDWYTLDPRANAQLGARWDGNPRRPPKKGEWYLSGAVIEAYKAHNDLDTPFHIAIIGKVATTHTTTKTFSPLKKDCTLCGQTAELQDGICYRCQERADQAYIASKDQEEPA